MLDQEGDCDDEEGERLTRAEALREKVDEAAEAVAAAGRLAMVVLKGSMWQPLVCMYSVCCLSRVNCTFYVYRSLCM